MAVFAQETPEIFTPISNAPAVCKRAPKFSLRTILHHLVPQLRKGATVSRPFSPVSFSGRPTARKSLLPRRVPIMPATRFARFLKRKLLIPAGRGSIPMR